MPDGWIGHIISSVVTGIVTAVGVAFKVGRRDAELVSHEQLDKRLDGYARKDQVEDIKQDIAEMRKESRDNFQLLIQLVAGGKGGQK